MNQPDRKSTKMPSSRAEIRRSVLRKHRHSLLFAAFFSILFIAVYPLVQGGRGSIALPVIAILMPIVALVEVVRDYLKERDRNAPSGSGESEGDEANGRD